MNQEMVKGSGDQGKAISARTDALSMHELNMKDQGNQALYELRKKIFLEAVEFQKRVEEMCLEAGFSLENAAVTVERADDIGDRYGFALTVESGQFLSE